MIYSLSFDITKRLLQCHNNCSPINLAGLLRLCLYILLSRLYNPSIFAILRCFKDRIPFELWTIVKVWNYINSMSFLKEICSNFSPFSWALFFSVQNYTSKRSCFTSSMFLNFPFIILVSSVKDESIECLIFSSISWIIIKKSSGPSTDPCRTPDMTSFFYDKCVFGG